ncbi:MAG: SIS domain-containing protein, partial [Promethearchaeota archaeon]
LAKLHPENTILSRAGKEFSVLATKTYISQLAILSAISLQLGHLSGTLTEDDWSEKMSTLRSIPDKIESMRPQIQDVMKEIARYLKFLQKAFVLGTGPDVSTALEAALKLKEGTRIVAQGYSYFEFLHGPITLADRENLIIAIMPPLSDNIEDKREKKVIDIINRVKRQQSSVLAVALEHEDLPEHCDFEIRIPSVPVEFCPLLSIIPIQYLVLEIAIQKGLDPDSPEWLTKVAHV